MPFLELSVQQQQKRQVRVGIPTFTRKPAAWPYTPAGAADGHPGFSTCAAGHVAACACVSLSPKGWFLCEFAPEPLPAPRPAPLLAALPHMGPTGFPVLPPPRVTWPAAHSPFPPASGWGVGPGAWPSAGGGACPVAELTEDLWGERVCHRSSGRDFELMRASWARF